MGPHQAADPGGIDVGHVGDVNDQQIGGVRPDLGLKRKKVSQQKWPVDPKHHIGPVWVRNFLYLQWLILHSR